MKIPWTTKPLTVACPRCGAPSGQPCINLSARRFTWQTWNPRPHRERNAKYREQWKRGLNSKPCETGRTAASDGARSDAND